MRQSKSLSFTRPVREIYPPESEESEIADNFIKVSVKDYGENAQNIINAPLLAFTGK